MIKTEFQLENVDQMQATATITMTIKEWRELAKELPERWPFWKLGAAINKIVCKANSSWSEKVVEE